MIAFYAIRCKRRKSANEKAILAKKIGMTQIFADDGSLIPVTVLSVGRAW